MSKDPILTVYAICKNESKNICKWIDNIKDEVDNICVLDTGSTDNSCQKLQEYYPSIILKQIDFKNDFRFDVARNEAMKLIPYNTDICMILDFDQFPRAGFGNIIRQAFLAGYTEINGDIINHSSDSNDLGRWISRNVHSYSPYWIWERPIHECLEYYGRISDRQTVYNPEFIIDHYPDNNKDRSFYINMLEKACELYPNDIYYGLYLGIELSKHDQIKKAVEIFDDYCFRYIDNPYTLKDKKEADQEKYMYFCQCIINGILIRIKLERFKAAIKMINACKDHDIFSFVPRRLYKLEADAYEGLGDVDKAIEALELSLIKCQSYSNDWRDDESLFKGEIEDRLSLFYYYNKNNIFKAFEYCIKAISLDPTNKRILSNLDFFYNKLKENCKDGE